MNNIDVDDVSLFIQRELSKMSAAYRASNFHPKEIARWRNNTFPKLMSYCTQDDGSAVAQKKEAISDVRRQQIGELQRYDVFYRQASNNQKGSELLAQLLEDFDEDRFVQQCRLQEKQALKLMSAYWGEHAPRARRQPL